MSSASSKDDSSKDDSNKKLAEKKTLQPPNNTGAAAPEGSAGTSIEHECECSLYTDTPSHLGLIPLARKKSSMVLSAEQLGKDQHEDEDDFYDADNEEHEEYHTPMTEGEAEAAANKRKEDSTKK